MARNKRTRGEYKARRVLEEQFRLMDKEERKRKPKPPKVNGPRAKFLAKYKLEGYESAKSEINSGFGGREVYTDEILNGWIEQENEK